MLSRGGLIVIIIFIIIFKLNRSKDVGTGGKSLYQSVCSDYMVGQKEAAHVYLSRDCNAFPQLTIFICKA